MTFVTHSHGAQTNPSGDLLTMHLRYVLGSRICTVSAQPPASRGCGYITNQTNYFNARYHFAQQLRGAARHVPTRDLYHRERLGPAPAALRHRL